MKADRLDLYYYTNNNIARDSFMNNALICACFNEKVRSQPLAEIDPTAIFLTHKKLDEKGRRIGLDESNFESPVVFRVSFPAPCAARIKCFLIQTEDEGYCCKEGYLSDYDEQTHVGVFIAPYIPLIYLTKVLFEAEDALKDLAAPSPDLWYPQEMYSILDPEAFSETINYDKLQDISHNNFNKDEVAARTAEYIKNRLYVYFTVVGTEEWRAGKYVMNFDPYLLREIGAGEEYVALALKNLNVSYTDLFKDLGQDFLVNEDKVKNIVFNAVLEELKKDNNGTVYNEDRFDVIARLVLDKLKEESQEEETINQYARLLQLIKLNLFNSSGIVFDELLNKLKNFQVLKALAIFLKNPHTLDIFADSIDAYRIEQQDARVAWLFFGTVNGMRDLNGKYKDHILLNRRVDAKATEKLDDNGLYMPIATEEELRSLFEDDADKLLRDFEPAIRRNLSPEEIYEFFASDQGKKFLSYEVVKKACPKVKVKGFDWKNYVYYVIPEGVKPGRVKKVDIDELVKKLKTEHIDNEGFLKDLLGDKSLFMKFYSNNEEFWKKLYSESRSKAVGTND